MSRDSWVSVNSHLPPAGEVVETTNSRYWTKTTYPVVGYAAGQAIVQRVEQKITDCTEGLIPMKVVDGHWCFANKYNSAVSREACPTHWRPIYKETT